MKESDDVIGCLAAKPENLSHEEATAAVYGGSLALQYCDKGDIQPSDNVMIYGASGTASGTLAVQYAKHRGARVTGCLQFEECRLRQVAGCRRGSGLHPCRCSPGRGNSTTEFFIPSAASRPPQLKNLSKRALTPQGRDASIDDGDLELKSSERLAWFARALLSQNPGAGIWCSAGRILSSRSWRRIASSRADTSVAASRSPSNRASCGGPSADTIICEPAD